MSLLRRIRSGCRQALVGGALLAAIPAAVQAAPRQSCDPFCGVLRFMSPPHAPHAPIIAAHRPPVRVARAVPTRRPLPRIVYATPRGTAPRYVYWPVVYPVYGYPGYGYVYYYAVRVY